MSIDKEAWQQCKPSLTQGEGGWVIIFCSTNHS